MTPGEQMRIKSYFAKSVDQAMGDARAELGDDAVLLNTRKVPATETGSAGYEVTFGVTGNASADVVTAQAVPPAVKAASVAAKASIAAAHVARQTISGDKVAVAPQKRASNQLASKLLDLRRELDDIRTNLPEELRARVPAAVSVERKPAESVDRKDSGPFASELTRLHSQLDEIQRLLARSTREHLDVGSRVPEIAAIYTHLLSADVDAALAKDIASRIERLVAAPGSSAAKERRQDHIEILVREELRNRVALAPRLEAEETEKGAVVVLVGPRGVGKTTSLAKLAASSSRFGSSRPARFLSLDLSRSTAHLQLQSVAATYSIAFQEAYPDHSLVRLIDEARTQDGVFIDTPGYASGDIRLLEETAATFAEISALDVHLVVPAYMKARDLRECIQAYAPFRPAKLLVTKFDEAKTLGSIYSEAARAGLKLSFITNGPGIPHDIRAVSSEDLLEMAFDRPSGRARQVA